MNINVKRIHANHTSHFSNLPIDGRIGFWADVKEVDSSKNRVNVIADTGQFLQGIPVYSEEWVRPKNKEDRFTASINLPPVGARVFILMPTGTIAGAFVLCSGYPYGDEATKKLFSSNDKNEIKKGNNQKKRITQGGWTETENYETGNKTLISEDEKIKIKLNATDKDSEKKGIYIEAFDYKINITPDNGLQIEGSKKFVVDAGSNSVEVKGTNIEVNGNIKMKGSSFQLNGSVAPSGTGALCAIPVCPLTGAPHTGNIALNN